MCKQAGIPIDSEKFSRFIDSSKIFDRTNDLMKGYLENWYKGSPETFLEDMRADLTTALGQ